MFKKLLSGLALGLACCAAPEPAAPSKIPAASSAPAEAGSAPTTASPEPAASSAPTTESAAPEAPAASAPAVAGPPPGWEPIPESRKGGFPGKPFAEVRAYAFDLRVSGRPTCSAPIKKDGTLCETVEGQGVSLSKEQAERLLALLKSPKTYGDASKCFLPHHGFVFYDEAGGAVAQLSVCFMCSNAFSLPKLPKVKMGEGYYGLSEGGLEALRGLCSELGLPKCEARQPGEFQ